VLVWPSDVDAAQVVVQPLGLAVHASCPASRRVPVPVSRGHLVLSSLDRQMQVLMETWPQVALQRRASVLAPVHARCWWRPAHGVGAGEVQVG
jgi:hypothetical protein